MSEERDELRERMLNECARVAGRVIAQDASESLVHMVRLYTQGDYINNHVSFQTKEERFHFWENMKSAFLAEIGEHVS